MPRGVKKRPSDGYTAEECMLLLMGLDPTATLRFSEHTGMWYVSLEKVGHCTSNGIGGVTEHHKEPREAVLIAFDNLVRVPEGYLIGVDYGLGERRYVRWNGAAFVDATPTWKERA